MTAPRKPRPIKFRKSDSLPLAGAIFDAMCIGMVVRCEACGKDLSPSEGQSPLRASKAAAEHMISCASKPSEASR